MKKIIKKLNPVDILTIIYLVIPLLLSVIFFNKLDKSFNFIILHITGIILVFLIAYFLSDTKNKFLIFIRFCYPIALYSFFYNETTHFTYLFIEKPIDPFLIKIDKWIFGYEPYYKWRELVNSKFINDILYFFYFTYYFMIIFTAVNLFIKHEINKLKDYMFRLSLTFYLCYGIYLFIPTLGPYFYFPIKEDGLFFANLLKHIYDLGAAQGTAMPSSHIAVAIITVFFMKYKHKFFYYFHTICVIGLGIAIVYCGYHYFIDGIAGISTGFIMYYISGYIYKYIS